MVLEKTLESLGLQRDPTSPFYRRSVLGVHWKDWCWSWNANTVATWYEELTHWKRPWYWEILRAIEGDDRAWDGWMALLTQWTWVWVCSRSWWWTGRPGMLQFMGSQQVRHDWATELNWTAMNQPWVCMCFPLLNHPLIPSPWLSQCTSFECPVSCIKFGLVIYFTYGNIHVSRLFSQIPPLPSPTESKSLFFSSVSLLLSCIWGHHYHLFKFHIYVLIYCIGIFLSDLLNPV